MPHRDVKPFVVFVFSLIALAGMYLSLWATLFTLTNGAGLFIGLGMMVLAIPFHIMGKCVRSLFLVWLIWRCVCFRAKKGLSLF